jgi:hypothetical protein
MGRPFACPGQAFRQLTESLNETLMLPRQSRGMDPINAYSAAIDYAYKRPAPPKPAESAAPFTPNGDAPPAVAAARKPEQAKPEQVKNRETDEQVTRQRVQDKFQGTMFDLRA